MSQERDSVRALNDIPALVAWAEYIVRDWSRRDERVHAVAIAGEVFVHGCSEKHAEEAHTEGLLFSQIRSALEDEPRYELIETIEKIKRLAELTGGKSAVREAD